MTKIDQMIKRLLLGFPTLYENRFEALAEILTNSGFEWRKGEIVDIFESRDRTAERSLAEYEKELTEARLRQEAEAGGCLDGLLAKRVAEAELNLLRFRHTLANIDVYTTQYAGVSYPQTWAWLWYTYRHGVSDYWSINNRPDNITPEWTEVIRDWLEQLIPSANSLMGFVPHDDMTAPFRAVPGYEKVFNWLRDTYKKYELPEHRERMAEQTKLAEEIVAKILKEEKGES